MRFDSGLVTAVLLSDGWHAVKPDTFKAHAAEEWFEFRDIGSEFVIRAPASSLKAVRMIYE